LLLLIEFNLNNFFVWVSSAMLCYVM
jgi:hypothetical protein